VLQFTVPVGGVAASATLLSYLVAIGPANATLPEARSAATLTLLAVGLCIVALVARPLSLAKWVLITSMGAAVVVLWIVPIGRRVFSLSLPPTTALSAEAAIVIVSVPLLMVLLRASEAIARRHKGTCNPGSRPACIRG
jgi:cation-transporting ATPase E